VTDRELARSVPTVAGQAEPRIPASKRDGKKL
jgi:hypothetical protein